jgi:hypothetical protein
VTPVVCENTPYKCSLICRQDQASSENWRVGRPKEAASRIIKRFRQLNSRGEYEFKEAHDVFETEGKDVPSN